MNEKIPWKEWRWAATVALVVVAASTIPYLAGYLSQTVDHRFAGFLPLADDQVPQESAVRFQSIYGKPVLKHKPPHRIDDTVRLFGFEHAVGDIEHPVVPSRFMEAERW